MAVRGLLRGRRSLHYAPPPHNGKCHGCGNLWDPRLRPAVPPPQPPPSARRPKVAGGKGGGTQGEEGAAEGSTGPTSALTSPPTPTFLKQMSPIDELKVRSSLPPPTRAAHCGGWEEERVGGVGQEPSPAHS